MYVKFVTLKLDKDLRNKQGLFMAAKELDEDGELDRYERDTVKNIINWFNENIGATSLLKEPGNNRCISWFKPEAKNL
jgi:hypothetical protein